MSEEQDREIEAALNPDVQADVGRLARAEPESGTDEWERWAYAMQIQVDKLFADNRMLKVGVGVTALGAALALGIGAMTMKTLTGIMGAIKQLGDNQVELANYMGTSGPLSPSVQSNMNGMAPVDERKVGDINTVDIDPNAVVGKPFEGPATEASEAAKQQLREDQAAGIIDLAKDHEEPA